MAEADGNRSRQGPSRLITDVEDRETHQAYRRFPVRRNEIGPRSLPIVPLVKRSRLLPSPVMPERSFGRTIRYRRTKLGISQAKLGDLVGRSAEHRTELGAGPVHAQRFCGSLHPCSCPRTRRAHSL